LLKQPEQINAQQIYEKCKTMFIREGCYIQEFKKLSETKDIPYLTNVLLAVQKRDPQAQKCHYIAHAIALIKVSENVNGWKDILKNVDISSCAEGFLHGVIEARIGNKSIANSPKEINEICAEVNKGTRQEYGCSHIMGHFILVDTFANIPNALKTCDTLSKSNDRTFKEECYAGVFMEFADRGNLEAHHITKIQAWTSDFAKNYKFECLKYNGLQGRACWKILGRMYAPLLKADPQTVFAACGQAPSNEYHWYCYLRAAGMMPQSPGFKEENFKNICSQWKDEKLFSICNEFLIENLLSVSPTYKPLLLSYCQAIPSNYQKNCYNTIQDYSPESLKKWQ